MTQVKPLNSLQYFLGDQEWDNDEDERLFKIFKEYILTDPHLDTLVTRFMFSAQLIEDIDVKVSVVMNFLFANVSYYVLQGLDDQHLSLKYIVLSSLSELDWTRAAKYCIKKFSPNKKDED